MVEQVCRLTLIYMCISYCWMLLYNASLIVNINPQQFIRYLWVFYVHRVNICFMFFTTDNAVSVAVIKNTEKVWARPDVRSKTGVFKYLKYRCL